MQFDVFSWTITSAHYVYNWLILSLPKTWLKNDLTKYNLRVVEKQRAKRLPSFHGTESMEKENDFGISQYR